ncbi:unnamed protein product [Urochloa decumbens]|uniref:Uncharacterized protein n=1 Tax=Urochloa decumbens TaxID=240449 RepID=A0ABC8ZXD0_9POAL
MAAAVTIDGRAQAMEETTARATKKTKWVKRKLTQEELDRMLSVPEDTRTFPAVTGADLARIRDPAERERYTKLMATVAELYYQSREEIKREQQYAREELATLGYIEREVEVTDDEEDEAGDN